MTTYEILLMLDPEQAESRQDDIVARARDLVEKSGGSWHSHDAWGRRRLAYPIAHKEEGVYHLVVFDTEAETLDEISRVLKIDDAVLRHMATRHIAGSRTSAPRDDAAAPVSAPAAVAVAEEDGNVAETLPTDDGDVAEEEYADPNTGSDEAGEEAGDARPEDLGEEE
ncbi:MAG TPA: 30S ribosomal protein S6 [Gaiellaceae bacterium]